MFFSQKHNLESGEDIENQTELVAVADIASGSYGDITWVIDANGKLTVEGTGEILTKGPNGSHTMQPWYDECFYIKSAEINVTGATSACGLFSSCQNLEYVDLRNFETDKITSMYSMFQNCKKLTNIEGLDNTSNVLSMRWMFKSCRGLSTLNLSSFKTNRVGFYAIYKRCNGQYIYFRYKRNRD